MIVLRDIIPATLPLPERYGINTGWARAGRDDFEAGCTQALDFSTSALELSAMNAYHVPLLRDFLISASSLRLLNRFGHLSVHAPVKGLDGVDWQELIGSLAALSPRISHFVFHPDVLPDAEILRSLGSRAAVENMDCRKSDYHYPDRFEELFEHAPEARLCLDVAHIWTMDPSLQLGHDFLDRFSDRLVELHVSGITAEGKHVETTAEHLALYRPLLERCPDVPWIFESHLVRH